MSFTLLNFGSLRGTTLKPKPEEINIQKSKFATNFRAGERVEKNTEGAESWPTKMNIKEEVVESERRKEKRRRAQKLPGNGRQQQK